MYLINAWILAQGLGQLSSNMRKSRLNFKVKTKNMGCIIDWETRVYGELVQLYIFVQPVDPLDSFFLCFYFILFYWVFFSFLWVVENNYTLVKSFSKGNWSMSILGPFDMRR